MGIVSFMIINIYSFTLIYCFLVYRSGEIFYCMLGHSKVHLKTVTHQEHLYNPIFLASCLND